ncbi:BLUF domain-containing protein [Sagittula salina]|uniref:BLUF domain-containing protein n=1 Tax=Sagittula salina TaxID=2820268 RepID=A0A940MFW3_9RHOB|nr:BLUF domain-containing protein [Sagittula salina]MBP0480910.1 BLUF domain-containing protein [Sagittula salina]
MTPSPGHRPNPVFLPPDGRRSGIGVADFSNIVEDATRLAPAPLTRAIIVSHTRTRLTDAQLDQLMMTEYALNSRIGLTGLLLYKSRSFFEVLEGPQAALDATLDRIFRDPRHFKMKVLLRTPAERRRFEGWSMGFRRLDGTTHGAPCYFPLTRRELEARFPHGATREILHFLRAYLSFRLPAPASPPRPVRCAVATEMQA